MKIFMKQKGEGFTDFMGALLLVFIAIYIWQNINSDDEVGKPNIDSNSTGYQPPQFTMIGDGDSEKLACDTALKNAHEDCPYKAKIISKESLTWVKPMLFGSNHWQCKANYVCKTNKEFIEDMNRKIEGLQQ